MTGGFRPDELPAAVSDTDTRTVVCALPTQCECAWPVEHQPHRHNTGTNVSPVYVVCHGVPHRELDGPWYTLPIYATRRTAL